MKSALRQFRTFPVKYWSPSNRLCPRRILKIVPRTRRHKYPAVKMDYEKIKTKKKRFVFRHLNNISNQAKQMGNIITLETSKKKLLMVKTVESYEFMSICCEYLHLSYLCQIQRHQKTLADHRPLQRPKTWSQIISYMHVLLALLEERFELAELQIAGFLARKYHNGGS